MKKYIGWSLIAVVVIIIGWFVFKTFIKKSSAAVAPDSSSGSSGSDEFPLKLGSKGNRVLLLQSALNDLLSNGQVPADPLSSIPDKLMMDGVFGTKTLEVVRYFFAIDQVDKNKYYDLTGGR